MQFTWFSISFERLVVIAYALVLGVCTIFHMPNQLHTRIDIKIKNLCECWRQCDYTSDGRHMMVDFVFIAGNMSAMEMSNPRDRSIVCCMCVLESFSFTFFGLKLWLHRTQWMEIRSFSTVFAPLFTPNMSCNLFLINHFERILFVSHK